jgi:L-rhamnose mutarotase
MQRLAFKMKLFPGNVQEYKTRHDNIWPELSALLKDNGISDYYIFLDEETNVLFGTYVVANVAVLGDLPHHPVMQKWWKYMADIMESNPDNSPVSSLLNEVFYMP